MVAWLRAAATMVTLAITTSCTPSAAPTATTSPTNTQPTYLCTTSTQGASPFPCDKPRYDEQQKVKALEDEAKAVYERYWKEYSTLMAAGGANEATASLKETATGSMLENAVSLLKFQKQNGWTPKPFIGVIKSRAVANQLREDSLVTLLTCEDTSGSILFDASGKQVGKGTIAVQNLAFKRFNGVLKIYSSASEGNGSCPIA